MITTELRKKLKKIGHWSFARYMRNRGFTLEYTLHVMFPQKYNNPLWRA